MCAVLGASLNVLGQDNSGPEKIEIHGYLAQGFLFGSSNNYLTTKSSDGSFEWNEGAINFGRTISDRLRMGLQIRTTKLGLIGKHKLALDWAYGDYKIDSKLGFRAGKVKSPVGLYNDTQDIDAVQMWVFLPQGIYPVDNRSYFLAHVGADAYGSFRLPKQFGAFGYQIYAGARTLDSDGGFYISAAQGGLALDNDLTGKVVGVDMRWRPGIRGLTLGTSLSSGSIPLKGVLSPYNIKLDGKATDKAIVYYGEFEKNKWTFASELRNWKTDFTTLPLPASTRRSWYASGIYRFNDRLSAGTYYSRSYLDFHANRSDPANFTKDWAITTRVDFNQYFYCKMEGHIMSGYGQGFYTVNNPQGLERKTQLLALRVGFTF
jgi:hypothetical protein